MPAAQVFRRGQIGTPLYCYCYAWRWKRVRSVFGTSVAAVPVADGILQRAVSVPEKNHTSRPLNRILRRILMRTWNANLASAGRWFAKKRFAKTSATIATLLLLTAGHALAQPAAQTDEAGGEAALKLPDLSSVSFLGVNAVSYTHLRAHETRHDLVCRL